MNFPNPPQARLEISQGEGYRESYANSIQVRMSLYDFLLMFGTFSQSTPDTVQIKNFQAVYLSPQNAKILTRLLEQHVAQYEAAFGEIRVEPVGGGSQVQ